jgi:hypothetical protein
MDNSRLSRADPTPIDRNAVVDLEALQFGAPSLSYNPDASPEAISFVR